jgi:hypothetical protein
MTSGADVGEVQEHLLAAAHGAAILVVFFAYLHFFSTVAWSGPPARRTQSFIAVEGGWFGFGGGFL